MSVAMPTTDMLVLVSYRAGGRATYQLIRFPDVEITYRYVGIEQHIKHYRYMRSLFIKGPGLTRFFMYRIRVKWK